MKLPGSLGKLNKAQYEQLITWLSLGLTDSEMAKRLHQEGLLMEAKEATLVKNINRWRKSGAQQAVILQHAHGMVDAKGKVRSHVDVIAELSDLVDAQKKRVAMMAEKESLLLLESVSNEMMRLMTMLEKLGRLQLETGVLRRVRVGQTQEDYEPPEQVEQDNYWTASMEDMFNAIETQFVELPEGGSTDV